MSIVKKKNKDFPGDPVVKSLPSNAEFMGLISGQGTKIPQAAGQLSPCMATEEACVPQLLSPFAPEPVLCNKRSPRATTRESLHAATKGPHVAMKTQSSKKKKEKKIIHIFTTVLRSLSYIY